MRGIYSAGILDQFIAHDYFPFDWYIGVSAGASNLAAYLGRQQGRNYRVYTDYCLREPFKSWRRWLSGGHLIDIDWLWDITERELPIGLANIAEYQGRFLVVATCADSGEPHYLEPTSDVLFQTLKASGNMPLAFKGQVRLHDRLWFDGGVSDSIPVREAYRRGARKIMVLRSNPDNYTKKAYRFPGLMRRLLKAYPAVAERLANRHREYNAAIDFIRNPPNDCDVIEVCPPSDLGLSQLTTDLSVLDNAYQAGLRKGDALVKSDFTRA